MKEKLLRQLEPRCGCELGASRGRESADEIPNSVTLESWQLMIQQDNVMRGV